MVKGITPLLSPAQAAEFLGVSRGTIYNWVYEKRIPYVKMGRLVRFRRERLEQLIRQNEQEARFA